jgi:RNA polymerase sigma factor for flagellar operon FliA
MKHEALWQLYAETGDLSARDTLMREHLGLVHHVARKISRSLSSEVELDELVSCGSIGLMNAVESFDPSRGHSFSTFAAPRIRGAILDELRRHDHATRSVRRKTRDLSAARRTLTQRLGAEPTDRQIAEHLQISIETLWRWESEVAGVRYLPIDRPATEDDRREAPALNIPGVTGDQIEEEVNFREEMDVLREAIEELKEQERVVLTMYYFEELNLREIAAVLHLTESRISQIRASAIGKLRSGMAALRQ